MYLPPEVICAWSRWCQTAPPTFAIPRAPAFAALDALNFRAGIFNILGIALTAFGALVVLLLLVRLAPRRGSAHRPTSAELSMGALIGVATRTRRRGSGTRLRRLDRCARRSRAWCHRVAAAGAIGRKVNQRTVETGVDAGEGRLLASGPRRGTSRIVSAPTTANDLARHLPRMSAADAQRSTVEALRDALATFTAAQYGRPGTRNESALDEAFEAATRAHPP